MSGVCQDCVICLAVARYTGGCRDYDSCEQLTPSVGWDWLSLPSVIYPCMCCAFSSLFCSSDSGRHGNLAVAAAATDAVVCVEPQQTAAVVQRFDGSMSQLQPGLQPDGHVSTALDNGVSGALGSRLSGIEKLLHEHQHQNVSMMSLLQQQQHAIHQLQQRPSTVSVPQQITTDGSIAASVAGAATVTTAGVSAAAVNDAGHNSAVPVSAAARVAADISGSATVAGAVAVLDDACVSGANARAVLGEAPTGAALLARMVSGAAGRPAPSLQFAAPADVSGAAAGHEGPACQWHSALMARVAPPRMQSGGGTGWSSSQWE